MNKFCNVFYAQSGGPTAVINATAAALIQAVNSSTELGTVFIGKNGIVGALNNELIDTSLESEQDIEQLKHTPGSAFGSCRYKLKDPAQDDSEYKRVLEVMQAHKIGYFFYNGGGDSQDTVHKVATYAKQYNYPIQCIGLPKTIDNDLPTTDCCPGFGSVAKYLAASISGTALDVCGMAATSTKVFILEVMGRHTGWLAASSALAKLGPTNAPHIILMPEIVFDLTSFLNKVKDTVEQEGYCIIVASEGIRNQRGKFLADSNEADAFGHKQLGGVAPILSNFIKQQLGIKTHWSVADYLQRSARYIASQTDLEHAIAIGTAAVEYALAKEHNVMLTINRSHSEQYEWDIGTTPLASVANIEKIMPPEFITEDGFNVTPACIDYLKPLINGQANQPYEDGLPKYVKLKNILSNKKGTKKLDNIT